MPAASFVAIGLLVASTSQAPAQRYTAGQDVRVCGEVKTVRAAPPACDATIRLSSSGEEFDVVLPASVAKELSIRPQTLPGAQACFTGRIAGAPGIPKLAMSTGDKVEVLSTNADPGFGAQAEVSCGSGLTMPRVITEKKPQYTRDAMRAKVQGAVELQVVINPDGTVGQARVVKSLHPDLDEQSMLAVKQWRFEPGMKDGKAVPVLVTIEMTFALRDK